METQKSFKVNPKKIQFEVDKNSENSDENEEKSKKPKKKIASALKSPKIEENESISEKKTVFFPSIEKKEKEIEENENIKKLNTIVEENEEKNSPKISEANNRKRSRSVKKKNEKIEEKRDIIQKNEKNEEKRDLIQNNDKLEKIEKNDKIEKIEKKGKIEKIEKNEKNEIKNEKTEKIQNKENLSKMLQNPNPEKKIETVAKNEKNSKLDFTPIKNSNTDPIDNIDNNSVESTDMVKPPSLVKFINSANPLSNFPKTSKNNRSSKNINGTSINVAESKILPNRPSRFASKTEIYLETNNSVEQSKSSHSSEKNVNLSELNLKMPQSKSIAYRESIMKRQSRVVGGVNENNLLKRLVKADEIEAQTYGLRVEINKLKKTLEDNDSNLKEALDKVEKSNVLTRELKKNVIKSD